MSRTPRARAAELSSSRESDRAARTGAPARRRAQVDADLVERMQAQRDRGALGSGRTADRLHRAGSLSPSDRARRQAPCRPVDAPWIAVTVERPGGSPRRAGGQRLDDAIQTRGNRSAARPRGSSAPICRRSSCASRDTKTSPRSSIGPSSTAASGGLSAADACRTHWSARRGHRDPYLTGRKETRRRSQRVRGYQAFAAAASAFALRRALGGARVGGWKVADGLSPLPTCRCFSSGRPRLGSRFGMWPALFRLCAVVPHLQFLLHRAALHLHDRPPHELLALSIFLSSQ